MKNIHWNIICSFLILIQISCSSSNFEEALLSPSSVFDEPAHVAAADTLTAELIRAPIIEISEDRYEAVSYTHLTLPTNREV